MISKKRSPRPYLLTFALSSLLAILMTGCMWGIVTDAETGDPIVGAEVTYTDSNNNSGTATTDGSGVYAFDQADVVVPAAGAVSFEITALGYEPQTAARLVQYDDSNGSLANLSTFWDVQHFSMTSAGMKISRVELEEVDFDYVQPPPLMPGAYANFDVRIAVYGTSDPVNPACDQTSAPMGLTFPDPVTLHPPDFGCVTPGTDLLASVTVNMRRGWMVGGIPVTALDISTATSGWITSANDWQEMELDSTDTSGPDSPNLEFHATIRYKTSTLVPLRCEE